VRTSHVIPLLLLAAACCRHRPETADTDTSVADPRGPEPWADLDAATLDPFHLLVQTPLEGAMTPDRLFHLDSRNLTFVRDESASQVEVLDPLFHHSGASWCLSTDLWPDFDDPTLRGTCAAGEVQVGRGALRSRTAPTAFAVDPAGLRGWMLSRDGGLQAVPADALASDPFRFLRPEDPVFLQGVTALEGEVALGWGGDRLWVASGTFLASFAEEGSCIETFELPGTTRDMAVVANVPWVLTEAGLSAGGKLLDAPGRRILATADGAWIVDPDAGLVHQVVGLDITDLAVDGLTGPLALDPVSGRLFVGVTDGVAALENGVESGRWDVGPVLDLVATPAHEIIGLQEGGQVTVWSDETAMVGAGPLDVSVAAFIERPRSSSPQEELPCQGEDSVHTCMSLAASQRPWLDDLPAPTALGLIPHMVERAVACGEDDLLATAWDAPRTEPGILYHDEPVECTADPTCLSTFMEEELQRVTAVGAVPTWSSGLSPQTELRVDWIDQMTATNTPLKYFFFGMSILPDINHEEDPRAKDAWPIDLDGISRAWTTSTLDTLADRGAGGAVAFYPGNNIPSFNLGSCPNLFLNECHQLPVGDGSVIDPTDTVALDVLLHRSLAMATGTGPFTFYFHLADLGTYDYLEGCTETGRIWSGDTCQAGFLQAWLLDVHQRFVLNGLVHWTLPGELERVP